MGSVHCLEVHLWIPVTVEEDDGVSSHQVQSQATGTGRNQENEFISVWTSKIVYLLLSQIKVRISIKSAVIIFFPPAIVLKNIEHGRKS